MLFMAIVSREYLFSYHFFWAVRGMMYYRETLELQCFLDFADDNGWLRPLHLSPIC